MSNIIKYLNENVNLDEGQIEALEGDPLMDLEWAEDVKTWPKKDLEDAKAKLNRAGFGFGDKWSGSKEDMIKVQYIDALLKNGLDEENSTSSAGGEYLTPYAFSNSKKKNKAKKPKEYTYTEPSIFETYMKQIHELSYKDFKSDTSSTSKQKINNSIKEISKQLLEVDRALTRVVKLKTEIGADQSVFLKSTIKKFGKISERLLKLGNKVREFSK